MSDVVGMRFLRNCEYFRNFGEERRICTVIGQTRHKSVWLLGGLSVCGSVVAILVCVVVHRAHSARRELI